jgi:hypothetical protein
MAALLGNLDFILGATIALAGITVLIEKWRSRRKH